MMHLQESSSPGILIRKFSSGILFQNSHRFVGECSGTIVDKRRRFQAAAILCGRR